MKIQGIYKIVNCINGKVYIGQSIDIKHRFIEHKSNVNKNKKHPLYDSIRKYEINNFEFIILEEIDNVLLLDLREQYWLDYYKAYDREYGYNLRLKAESNRGLEQSQEQRRKNSDANKGKKKPPRTKEHRIKLGLSLKGRKHTDEHKRKNSEANKGKKHSEESRLKISKGHKGKVLSDETKDKLSEITKKQWENADFRKAVSEGMLKLWQDPVFREKIKQSKKQRKERNRLDLINQVVRQEIFPNLSLESLDSGHIFN